MSDSSHDILIRSLGGDLTPVKRLAAPGLRSLAWLALVAAIGLGLAAFTHVEAAMHRLMATPDMALAAAGSALTAILAVIAAFELSLPDRSRAWALLPLPAAALWIGASGLGCLRPWLIPGTSAATPVETEDCLVFILGVSIPLSLALMLMLRRGFSLQPKLTAAIAGLAAAAAAATLLNFIHPYDAAAVDLIVHAFAVAVVIAATVYFGGQAPATKKFPV